MTTTTAQLLALGKEAADLTNVTDYVTDATWTSWTNAAIAELHRFVTNKFKATFFRQYDFTLTAGQSQITLPSNFWRLKGLDLDPDTIRRRTVRPYNFAERNRIRQSLLRDFDPLLYTPDRFYNVIGSSLLKIQSQEQAAGVYRLYYVPKPRLLGVAQALPIVAGSDKAQKDTPTAGVNTWIFANFGWLIPYVGDTLTIAAAQETDNIGAHVLTVIPSTTTARSGGLAANETFDANATATLTPDSLDAELDPYAEYVWLTAARKSLIKEESYQQAKALAEQIALIREDLTESLETDQGGPKTIIDTDDWGG